MATRNSSYVKAKNEWYIETDLCVNQLFSVQEFEGQIHDPCCGIGTIPKIAEKWNYKSTGADIVDRCQGKYKVQDFLKEETLYDNIVTNPPFSLYIEIVNHAFSCLQDKGRLAILATEKFLFSQKRNPLFDGRVEKVIILSKRPSIPPGELLMEKGESIRKGGSIDFVWVIWRKNCQYPISQIKWVI